MLLFVNAIIASIVASTGIVLLNKHLFTLHDFTFPTTLTGWHLIITSAFLACSAHFGIFEKKKLTRKYVLYFSLCDTVAMALQNLSLTCNTVNFYQTCKLFTIPVTIGLECLLGQPLVKGMTAFSLFVITTGVGLCTGANLQSNPAGIFVGMGATLFTAVVLVSTTWLQKTQDLSSTQLLHNVAGINGALLCILGPFLDQHLSGRNVYTDYVWSTSSKVLVGCTCILAVAVNSATFYLLGKVSPVTYQVIGQLKTAIVYGTGYYFYDSKNSNVLSIFGAAVTLTGCVCYAAVSHASG